MGAQGAHRSKIWTWGLAPAQSEGWVFFDPDFRRPRFFLNVPLASLSIGSLCSLPTRCIFFSLARSFFRGPSHALAALPLPYAELSLSHRSGGRALGELRALSPLSPLSALPLRSFKMRARPPPERALARALHAALRARDMLDRCSTCAPCAVGTHCCCRPRGVGPLRTAPEQVQPCARGKGKTAAALFLGAA